MEYKAVIKNVKEFDAVVCGAGPSGFCAALQCGRAGLKTALVEKFGTPGGNMTVGGITSPALFHAWGEQIIAGIGWELMERLSRAGWAVLPDIGAGLEDEQNFVRVNALAAAREIDAMCTQAGVQPFFHHNIFDVAEEEQGGGKRVTAVYTAAPEGISAFTGKVFIDCTGNGDVAARGGFPFEMGDPVSGELQAGSYSFYITGVRKENISEVEVSRKFNEALKKGGLKIQDYWPGVRGEPSTMFIRRGANCNHIDVDGTDSVSKTRANREGRDSAMRLVEWMRDSIKGAEKAEAVFTSPETWPRETRRVIGIDKVTFKGYMLGEKNRDALCYSYYPLYIHRSEGNMVSKIDISEGVVPVIPAGALIPGESENLLTAGRCISGEREAFASYRVQAPCMATGQAAGAIAVDLCHSGKSASEFNRENVKKLLRENNAIVPEI